MGHSEYQSPTLLAYHPEICSLLLSTIMSGASRNPVLVQLNCLVLAAEPLTIAMCPAG